MSLEELGENNRNSDEYSIKMGTRRTEPAGNVSIESSEGTEYSGCLSACETDDPASLGYMVLARTEEAGAGKRLIVRNHDMDINLSESPEGFDILRRVLDIIAGKNADSGVEEK